MTDDGWTPHEAVPHDAPGEQACSVEGCGRPITWIGPGPNDYEHVSRGLRPQPWLVRAHSRADRGPWGATAFLYGGLSPRSARRLPGDGKLYSLDLSALGVVQVFLMDNTASPCTLADFVLWLEEHVEGGLAGALKQAGD